MIPHGEPLEQEEIEVCSRVHNLLCATFEAKLVPRILHAGANGTEVGRGNPEIVSLEEVPHDAADNVRVNHEKE